ncbi:MAG: hypothetical protein HFE63_00360 [Clostridiales bacterium]|nr:hypothetical protein [Clostridiales bacterium]
MKKRIDTVMLAVALFCISGAVLAYNIGTVDGDIAVSLSELAGYKQDNLISSYTRMAMSDADENPDAIEVGAVPTDPETKDVYNRSYELLEPIIKSPVE